MAMKATEIASMIERLQACTAATGLMLVTFNDNDFLNLLAQKGYDHGSTVRLGRRDNTYYTGLDLWKSVYLVRDNRQFNLDFVTTQFATIISWVGQDLSDNGYFDKAPVLEFFRHIRNGISHGNRFSFLGKEPSRPAKCRSFEITKTCEGTCVLFDYLGAGDVMDMFDDVKAHLETL